MRRPAKPTMRLGPDRHLKIVERPPPKNKKKITVGATLLYQQATPDGVLRMRSCSLLSFFPSVHFSFYARRLLAFANASSNFATSFPPPRALSGRPPPLPPTMGAID